MDSHGRSDLCMYVYTHEFTMTTGDMIEEESWVVRRYASSLVLKDTWNLCPPRVNSGEQLCSNRAAKSRSGFNHGFTLRNAKQSLVDRTGHLQKTEQHALNSLPTVVVCRARLPHRQIRQRGGCEHFGRPTKGGWVWGEECSRATCVGRPSNGYL